MPASRNRAEATSTLGSSSARRHRVISPVIESAW
jgi:hypothetical protein